MMIDRRMWGDDTPPTKYAVIVDPSDKAYCAIFNSQAEALAYFYEFDDAVIAPIHYTPKENS
jgi:hypothetical protein